MKTHLSQTVLLLAFALSACSGDTSSTKPKDTEKLANPRAVSVAQVEMRQIGGALTASGLLVPYEEAAVGSELSGFRIAAVMVDEGAVVRKGEPLARLDPTLIEAKIAQARAQLAQARVQAGQAQAEAGRVRGLDGSGVLSDEQIATRRAQADSAGAAATAAEAQLKDLLTQRMLMTIRAPVGGIVLERAARPGAVANGSGDPLFRIARDRRIELDAEIPEDALIAIGPGTKARVSLPSGIQLDGMVRRVSPRVDSGTKLGRARISLPIDPQVRTGGFARAEFQKLPRMAAAVPESALQFEAGGSTVMVIGADNRAHSLAVRTGERADGWVELLDGPPPGTRVALGGAAFLLDGDRVEPVKPATGK
ncbi:HlyD family secretion protein [Novosphingobium sp. CF614]|nr:HlyD family secretion protein [Novosphingobium sp. CF614]